MKCHMFPLTGECSFKDWPKKAFENSLVLHSPPSRDSRHADLGDTRQASPWELSAARGEGNLRAPGFHSYETTFAGDSVQK